MTTRRFYRRRFLNRRGFHAGAYVFATCEVETYRYQNAPDQFAVDAQFTVADCGRAATLDFHVNSDAEARNALHKARLLRDAMVDFTAALETAVDDWRERQG